MELNKKQQDAYNTIIFEKNNIFLTGAGGTGKSFLIKKLKKDLETKYCRNVAVTAMTGVSANVINGATLHSVLGLRLGVGSYDALYKMILTNKKILTRWRCINVLIVDEVSMLSITLFEKIEKLARAFRNDPRPFGGMQIVLVGDMAQLPPVKDDKFIFESSIWNKVIEKTIYLTEIIRQTDPVFRQVLNKVRMGIVDEQVEQVLKSREIKYKSKDGFIPTMLESINAKVDKVNQTYYDRLEGAEHTYKIKPKFYKNIVYKEKYLNNLKFEDELSLKMGAQVMYLTNNIEGLFNGSRGIIVGFVDNMPLVLFTNGMKLLISPETLDIEEQDELIMSYTQIPLKLAYSVTVHRAQGCTLSLTRINFKNIFEYGQAYTALSRVKSLEGLYIRNLDFNVIKCHPSIKQFYEGLEV